MGLDVKTNCSQMLLSNLVWNIKFISLLTTINPMEELKNSIISSKHACLNMYQNPCVGPGRTIGLCCISFFTK